VEIQIFLFILSLQCFFVWGEGRGHHGRDHMVVGLTTTCALITIKVVSSNPIHGEMYSIQQLNIM